MRLAVLQHVPFEGPAAIADWAAERGIPVSVSHLYRGEPLPGMAEFDILAIMGGPMSVNDGGRYDWLDPEIAFAGEAVRAGKVVLGVCLGAQIIAKTLGARVYGAGLKEIGWFPVYRTPEDCSIFEGVPARFTAFHWHGETFDLPTGAARAAFTSSIPNQAFTLGDRVLGVQFHMEATAESVRALLENAADEIGSGPYEQAPEAIQAGIAHCDSLRPILNRVLDNLTGATAIIK